MLEIVRKASRIRAESATAIFEWDMERGGQLTGFAAKTGTGVQRLLVETPVPNLTLDLGNGSISLDDSPATATFVREDDGCFVFMTKAEPNNLFTVEQRFDVFREGVVFCEFMVQIKEDKTAVIRNAEMTFPLDVGDVERMRGNYVSRDPSLKQDVTTIHVLSDGRIAMDRETATDVPHLLPIYGLDLGWKDSRYFSHRVEMIIEDSTSIGNSMLGPTRTVAGPSGDGWSLKWKLCENIDESFKAPFFYRNRWGLLCGAGRREAGKNGERPLVNNAMAARVCHVMYPYVREGNEWPWTSVPIRQTFYQDVQLARGNPTLERLDEAVGVGCNVLVLHQFWMTNGGSNGEPVADYTPHDPEWMHAFIDRAHSAGMRVLLYGRGMERYQLFSDYFETYLKKDWDGVYLDWSHPCAMGFCKTSAKHFSAYDYFMFMRRVRARVGDNGIMIAHSAVQTYLGACQFDATLVGEFSVMHSGLLAGPEESVSYAMLGGCGTNLIAGNSADRLIFSSQLSSAYCAALGYSAHPFMEPGKDFNEVSAYMHPLWQLWQTLGDTPVRVYNPAIGDAGVATWSDNALHPVIYQEVDGRLLVIVTNLSDQPLAKGSVEINLDLLSLSEDVSFSPLDIPGTHKLTVEGNRIVCREMPAWFYGGVMIERNK